MSEVHEVDSTVDGNPQVGREEESRAKRLYVEESDATNRYIRSLVYFPIIKSAFTGIEDHRTQLIEQRKQLEHSIDDLGRVLKAWSVSHDEFDYWFYSDPDSYAMMYWDEQSQQFYETLEALLSHGIRGNSWHEDTLSDIEWNNLEIGGYGLLRNLARDESFEFRTELLQFLRHFLWRGWISLSRATDGPAAKIGFAYHRNERRYDLIKKLVFPILEEATRASALFANSQDLNIIFEGLYNIDASEEAQELMYLDGLSKIERQRVVIEYINVFGFIAAIDSISKEINKGYISDQLHAELKDIYEELEGDKASQIVDELTEIYQGIDFSQYALNNPEVTEKETDILEKALRHYHEAVDGHDIHEAEIFDIGAGVGRHSLELAGRGYGRITALEYEQKHVELISQQNPNIRVIQGDWHKLCELYREGRSRFAQVDLAFILGRSITHNRRPSDMFQFFDQFSSIIKDEGIGVIDFEDVAWGIRGQKIAEFEKNLKEKGVLPMESKNIFDGPNDYLRFNRQILSQEQVEAYAKLFGFKLIEVDHQTFGENDAVRDIYYTLRKDGEFDPREITRDELMKLLRIVGMMDPGTEFDMFINPWGMTVSQALMFGLDDYGIVGLNEMGRGPKVFIQFEGEQMRFKAKL